MKNAIFFLSFLLFVQMDSYAQFTPQFIGMSHSFFATNERENTISTYEDTSNPNHLAEAYIHPKGDRMIIPFRMQHEGDVIIWVENAAGKAVYCYAANGIEKGDDQEMISLRAFEKGN
jgi:hypothetical protein